MVAQLQQQLASDIRAGLRAAKIGYGGIQRVGTGVSVTITKRRTLLRQRKNCRS